MASRPVLALVTAVVLGLFAVTGWGAATPDSLAAVDADLKKAKEVYERAGFQEAALLLRDAVRRLEGQHATSPRVDALAEAYLHLALAQLGAGERAEAKDAFRHLVRLDAKRTLDADIFAPKVLALLEEARAEVAQERPAASPTPAPRRGAAGKALLLGGAVSTGLGGVLALSSAGGSPTPRVTPPPVAPALSPSDIELAGSDPAPGSTIRISINPPLRLSLWIVHSESGEYQLTINEMQHDGTSANCLYAIEYPRLKAGEPALVTVVMHGGISSLCRSPFEVLAMEVWLRRRSDLKPAAHALLLAQYSVRP